MPSAEKVASTTVKAESMPPNEQQSVENSQKESDHQSPIQQVILIISNKIRNLEKRKNKLESYMKEEESGKDLSFEQKKAISKYDEVIQGLDLSKDFFKQFQVIASAASKEAKREARKNVFTRQLQEATKVREVLVIQDLLGRLNDENIRNDFIQGRNGACQVDTADFDFLEKFSKHVIPTRPNFSNEPSFATSVKMAADHLSFVVDGRTRQFLDSGFTYDKIKELFDRIESCEYWKKDIIKVIESAKETSTRENDLIQQQANDDEELQAKQQYGEPKEVEKIQAPSAPALPTPSFNGGMVSNIQYEQAPLTGNISVQQQVPSSVPLKTTVTAVENAYFNQLKYSQPQGSMINNSLPMVQQQPQQQLPTAANPLHEVIASGNSFSFLQDSLLELESLSSSSSHHAGSLQAPQQQQQQKLPANVIQTVNQPKVSPAQMYPPGLKLQQSLQNSVSHIPVNYQSNQQQQQTGAQSQVQSHMIPKQQQQLPGSFSNNGGGPNQTQQVSRPYPGVASQPTHAQFQQAQQLQNNVQNLQKPMDQSASTIGAQKLDNVNSDGRNAHMQEKEKSRDEWNQQNNQQQPPQIDTWVDGNNYPSRSSGNGFNRNRTSGSGKYGGYRSNGSNDNNFRSSHQSRNSYAENGSAGDSQRSQDGAPASASASASSTTFFRNNERFNNGGSSVSTNNAGVGRFEQRSSGNYKSRNMDNNGGYRSGSRFAAQGGSSTNSTQRKP